MGSGGHVSSNIFPPKRNPIHKIQKLMSFSKVETTKAEPQPDPSSPKSVLQMEPPPPSIDTEAAVKQLDNISVPLVVKETPSSIFAESERSSVLYTVEFPLPGQPDVNEGKNEWHTHDAAASKVVAQAVNFALIEHEAEMLVHVVLEQVLQAVEADKLAREKALQDEQISAFASDFVKTVIQNVLAVHSSPNNMLRNLQDKRKLVSVYDVAIAASTASKSGRLWGLVSAITNKISLATYIEDDERETAQENPFRWL